MPYYSVLGNHELALLDEDYLKTFNPYAKKALIINKKRLSGAALQYISTLQSNLVRYNCRFVHGLPPDIVASYIFNASDQKLINIMRRLKQKITFVGHTHKLGIYELNKERLKKICKVFLAKDRRYIINTGSVGQPRDNNIAAKYIIWDSAENTIEPRFVSYDYYRAVKKMKKAGIPKRYAEQLVKVTV